MRIKFSMFGLGALLLATAWTAPVPGIISTQAKHDAQIPVDRHDRIFSFVKARQANGKVTVAWKLHPGQPLAACTLQKAMQAGSNKGLVEWEDIFVSDDMARSNFQFTDEQADPGLVNYRVIVTKADGIVMSSCIATALVAEE